MALAQILIGEDERIIALELTRCLRQLGSTVAGTAASGPEAMRKARALHPTLVAMDIGLTGGLNGVEVGEAIRATLQIPVIYVTAYAPEHLRLPAETIDSWLYIRQPFDERQLRATLERALGVSMSR
jgi:CheY-like chemotaxis protein